MATFYAGDKTRDGPEISGHRLAAQIIVRELHTDMVLLRGSLRQLDNIVQELINRRNNSRAGLKASLKCYDLNELRGDING